MTTMRNNDASTSSTVAGTAEAITGKTGTPSWEAPQFPSSSLVR